MWLCGCPSLKITGSAVQFRSWAPIEITENKRLTDLFAVSHARRNDVRGSTGVPLFTAKRTTRGLRIYAGLGLASAARSLPRESGTRLDPERDAPLAASSPPWPSVDRRRGSLMPGRRARIFVSSDGGTTWIRSGVLRGPSLTGLLLAIFRHPRPAPETPPPPGRAEGSRRLGRHRPPARWLAGGLQAPPRRGAPATRVYREIAI
jgi:hypothetical protein